MIRSFSRMVPQHTLAKVILQYIQKLFPDRLVSCSDYPYPPRSPDLTPPGAFLWGILKDKCFRDPMPLTLDALKLNVERDVHSITEYSLRAMITNIDIRRGGAHKC